MEREAEMRETVLCTGSSGIPSLLLCPSPHPLRSHRGAVLEREGGGEEERLSAYKLICPSTNKTMLQTGRE